MKKIYFSFLIIFLTTCYLFAAVLDESKKYYFAQLVDTSNRFYQTIEQMLENGIFNEPNNEYNLLTEPSKFSQDEINAYLSGSLSLLHSFRTALDAFSHDYNDVFWIDYDKLTLKFYKKDGKVIGTISSGNFGSYFCEGIVKDELLMKKNAYEAAINEIVESTKEKESLKEKVEIVYKKIQEKMTYKLEHEADPDKKAFVASPLSIITGQAKCAGYSRVLKACLDRLKTTNILIEGQLMDERNELLGLHMWNYIKIDENWYGLDVTVDDSLSESSNSENGLKYFFASFNEMNNDHFPSGKFSLSDFEFNLPTIYLNGFTNAGKNINTQISLKVVDGTDIEISYKNMGLKNSIKNGYYWLIKFVYFNDSKDYDYFYFLEKFIEIYGFIDTDNFLRIPFQDTFEAVFIQITYLAPTGKNAIGETDSCFKGTELDIIDETYINPLKPGEGYRRPPYLKKAIPSVQVQLDSLIPTKIIAIYDEELVTNDKEFVVKISVNDGYAQRTAKVEKVKIINSTSIEFIFTPSTYYGGDSLPYTFIIEGLEGKESKKPPNSFGYLFKQRSTFGCPLKYGETHYLFGKPQLLENPDLLKQDVFDSNELGGSGIEFQLALVATKVSASAIEAIDSTIASEGDKVKGFYSIDLNLCAGQKKKISILDGKWVRVNLPFPEGFGPEDEGTEFKAFHFKKKNDGTYEKEEIQVFVSNDGLVVICTSFSPFAVEALTSSEKIKEYKILTRYEQGGKIVNSNGNDEPISTIEEIKEFKVKANNGFYIESILLNEESIAVPNKETEFTVTIKKENLNHFNSLLYASFVSKERYEYEEQQSLTVCYPTLGEITVEIEKKNGELGNNVIFTAKVSGYPSYVKYKWYKDNKIIQGENKKTLTINYVTENDNGLYEVEAINNLGSISKSVRGSFQFTASPTLKSDSNSELKESKSRQKILKFNKFLLSFILALL